MQKQKEQVMQPVTMAILIAIVFLSYLPSFSARINSSFPPVLVGNPVSTKAAEKSMDTTDDDLPTNLVKIPVFGNVHPDGFYYVQIKIGTPPITYNLDIDTGSDLTWFPKDESRRMQYVRCDEPRCRDVQESIEGKCKNTEPCDYKIDYHDGYNSEGLVVIVPFAFQLKEGSSISLPLIIGSSSLSTTDNGMLGLGKGKISILSQLQEQRQFANIFGHCLSRNPGVQGFMFIGKDFDYPRCFTWVPMSSDSPYYSLTMVQVTYGKEQVWLNNKDFVLDSGTANTYFVDSLYQRLLSKVAADMPLQQVPGDGKQPCWKGTTPFSHFSSIYLRLQDGKALQIPPENYLITNKAAGFVCLGILNGLDARLNDFNLIGAISMQNMIIAYDNERQQIGWAHVSDCSNPLASNCG